MARPKTGVTLDNAFWIATYFRDALADTDRADLVLADLSLPRFKAAEELGALPKSHFC